MFTKRAFSSLEAMSGGIQGDDALLSLAGAADIACGQVHIVDVQGDEFADTDARCVQKLQHGAVPEALVIHAEGLLQKQLHLTACEDLRVLALHLAGGKALGGVLFHQAVRHQEVIKGLYRGQEPGHRGGGFAVILRIRHIVLDHLAVRLSEKTVLGAVQILRKLGHIPQIGEDGILRGVFFLRKIGAKARDITTCQRLHSLSLSHVKIRPSARSNK